MYPLNLPWHPQNNGYDHVFTKGCRWRKDRTQCRGAAVSIAFIKAVKGFAQAALPYSGMPGRFVPNAV